VTPTAKKSITRRSRFTGPGNGCLFFVTFFGASKESKYNGFNAVIKYNKIIITARFAQDAEYAEKAGD
jgi:hypothetical protein